jgi:hypothetical protein
MARDLNYWLMEWFGEQNKHGLQVIFMALLSVVAGQEQR